MANSPEAVVSSPTGIEESLLSLEKIDRASPELWPEQIPGMLKFMQPSTASSNTVSQPWTGPLDAEDHNLIHHYSNLTVTGLITEVRKLHDVAYQLGLEESKEMTRGKYLNVLERKS